MRLQETERDRETEARTCERLQANLMHNLSAADADQCQGRRRIVAPIRLDFDWAGIELRPSLLFDPPRSAPARSPGMCV